jgi:putative membrane protein
MVLKNLTRWLLIALIIFSIYAVATIAFQLPAVLPVTQINTLVAFSFAVLHAAQREGWRKAALLAVIVFLTGLTFESLGVATGLVYGPYHYSDRLGAKFLDLVPYLIPIAWTMMMYPSMVIAQSISPRAWKGAGGLLAAAAVGGVVMTAWDVGMDPMMVAAGHWVWEVQGPYFGVPLQNFWGWWLTTFIAIGLYLLLSRRINDQPTGIPDRWVVWSYLTMAASTVLTDLLVGLEGPALAGIFAMLPWVVMGILATSQAKTSTASAH